MIQYATRQARRFAVLLPGLVIVYFSVRKVLPYFDRRLPLSVAIFITYILAAYVFIPAIIRLFRIIIPANHLPLYCVTPDGFASDPLNIGIIGTRRELITAMEAAGWYVADRHSLKNVFRLVAASALGQVYRHAPVSTMYLFGRKQDIAFEIPIENSPGQRHHVRFWATTYEKKKRLNVHGIAWQHRRQHVFGDNLLWVGAASLDTGLNVIRHNLQVTHMIDPNTDSERELIVQQLRAAGNIGGVETLKLDNPYRLVNRVWRGYLQTDGKMSVVTLKRMAAGQRQV
ncbi:MAG TPA: LssY C-terminal domain-containing protein [Candidatus Saccharimonadales bacterium]|nr:LssY C-terminal domain-containing protein [Candidatus Saccharimonadales bacterium]